MKKKQLITTITISGTIVIILIVGLVYIIQRKNKSKTSANMESNVYEMDDYDKTIQMMLSEYSSTIFVLGDDCYFRDGAPIRKIEKIDDEMLKSESKYNFIIINECVNELNISNDEYNILRKYVIEGTYNFIYIGKSKLGKFVNDGFLHDDLNSNDYGFAVRHCDNTIISTVGIWTQTDNDLFVEEDDKEYLSESLISYMQLVFMNA